WQRTAKLRLVRGSHLILPRLNHSDYAVAHFGEDGRIFFVIPWGSRNDLSLIGTTDVDHETGADDVRISPEEIRYMLTITGKLFPRAASSEPISAYSSLRPLVESGESSATKTSREHRVWNSGSGVLHVAGGKYTTYRAMSEEAANLVAGELARGLVDAWRTVTEPVGGNSAEKIEQLRSEISRLADASGLAEEDVEYLVRDFGVLAPAVLDALP
ncbi:MAG: FAD-dependent oxidoreductase, partial [bacterium]|nr:FAD-dependent oxidoreductase [bacterium]